MPSILPALLLALGVALSQSPVAQPPKPAPPNPGGPAAAQTAVLAAALAQPVAEVRLDETPLSDVLTKLGEHAGGNMHVLWRDLQDHGIDPDTSVTLHLAKLPLARVLQEVFAAASPDERLGWEIRDGVLVIATQEFLDRRQYARAYPLYDVLDRMIQHCQQDNGPESSAMQYAQAPPPAQLEYLLTQMVAPDTWRENGGSAMLTFTDGVLAVRQSRAQHGAIERFFAELRDARGIAASPAPPGPQPGAAGEREVQKALQRELPEFSVSNVALGDVLARLGQASGLNFVVRWHVLGDAGLERDLPVTLRLRGLSVGAVLRRVLEEATDTAAAAEVRDGALIVSTAEDLERELVPRMYLVSDLLASTSRESARAAANSALVRAADYGKQDPGGRASTQPASAEQLAACIEQAESRFLDMLRGMTAPDSWRETGGGTATAKIYDGVLVVYQSASGHMEVTALLQQLRDAYAAQP